MWGQAHVLLGCRKNTGEGPILASLLVLMNSDLAWGFQYWLPR